MHSLNTDEILHDSHLSVVTDPQTPVLFVNGLNLYIVIVQVLINRGFSELSDCLCVIFVKGVFVLNGFMDSSSGSRGGRTRRVPPLFSEG